MSNRTDLQMHSTVSDGVLTPDELVARCANQGLTTIAVTDHDTLDHIPAVLAAGKRIGVRVIPGTELSVSHQGFEFHMLAFFVDAGNVALRARLEDFRQSRLGRMDVIIERFHELGFELERADIERLASCTVGKPHIAQAVLERNVARFASEGITTYAEVIAHYLADGCPAHVERAKFEAAEAIRLVHGAGGLAFLAHPGWTFRKDFGRFAPFLAELKGLGLDGVEVVYFQHDEATTLAVRAEATRLRLLESAGSDFHGPDRAPYSEVGQWNAFGLTLDLGWIER